jgi:hypothetical protein
MHGNGKCGEAGERRIRARLGDGGDEVQIEIGVSIAERERPRPAVEVVGKPEVLILNLEGSKPKIPPLAVAIV